MGEENRDDDDADAGDAAAAAADDDHDEMVVTRVAERPTTVIGLDLTRGRVFPPHRLDPKAHVLAHLPPDKRAREEGALPNRSTASALTWCRIPRPRLTALIDTAAASREPLSALHVSVLHPKAVPE
jgi:hypothetical protein